MTAALEGGEWSAARPGRTLPPGKTRYPLYRRLGGPQGRSGRAENLVPTGIRSRTIQPVVSRYTNWATRPTIYIYDSCTVSPSSNKLLDIRDVESCSRNQYWRGKAVSITYSRCVFVALGIQRAMRMRRVILASVTCLPLQYFSTLYQTARLSGGGYWT